MVFKWYKPVFKNVFETYSAKNQNNDFPHLRLLDFI